MAGESQHRAARHLKGPERFAAFVLVEAIKHFVAAAEQHLVAVEVGGAEVISASVSKIQRLVPVVASRQWNLPSSSPT